MKITKIRKSSYLKKLRKSRQLQISKIYKFLNMKKNLQMA